ncbi:MAG: LamG domain-containing protein [Phycisphaerae bacterium]|nr:LamG domain-containing protein [Phycisphaerae bacterium]
MRINTNITYKFVPVVVLSLLSGVALGSSSCWRFNEGAGETAFDSLGGRHATIRGNPVWVTGSFGKALQLDGDGDYLEVGRIPGLSAEQTKMLWIYISSITSDGVYLIDEGGSGNNNWLELYDPNGGGNPYIRAGFDSFNYIDSKVRIKTGCWYHIAVVTKASGNLAIYINGLLDSSASEMSADNRPQAIVIGADAATKTGCFNGMIDDVAIYDRPFSSGEVRQVYQEGVARYRHTFDNTRIVIKRIQETIAANDEAVERLDEVLNKAQIAVQALAAVLATDYNPHSNQGSEMITAKQKIQAAMMNIQRSRESLTMCTEQLNGALRQLGHFLPKSEIPDS